jgi:hypothetical protein
MKALLVSAAAVGLLTAAPAFAQAGPSASATANADAEIVAPIAIAKTADLNFGRIAADAAPGTVSVDASGNLSSSSPNLVISGSTGSAAAFHVTGAANLAYSSTVPATVSLSDGTNTMTAAIGRVGGDPTLDGTGADDFNVTGTLTVGAGQAAGNYSGSFSVSVQYN